jgi:hypothetical protein
MTLKNVNNKNFFQADTLYTGESLHYNEFLVSANGCFNATISANGNLGPML